YASAFPAGFREDYAARLAVRDIELMEPLLAANAADNLLTMQLYRPLEAPPGALRFKIYRAGQPTSLSHSLPMLEHLGVRVNEERPYCIEPADAAPIWMHDFGMETIDGSEVELDEARARFEDAFARIWSGELENDDLNRLVL
ncbi:NAD-glutamate dehydrogenase, partial [Escherichia coli]|nr:NAD-glutamate dehydrogenase [Escherichia coli]